MYKKIMLNQCGYYPSMPKHATFVSEQPVTFEVRTSDGTGVLRKTTTKAFDNKAAGERNYIGDFSEITEPGMYYLFAEGLGESDIFPIGETVYDSVLQKTFAFFYYQRCGHTLPKEAAGIFAHEACHTGIATAYTKNDERDVTGGWHDAGDYGRYVGPGAMAVAQLLYAYEINPDFVNQYVSPEDALNQTKLPACLEEIKYELDWMLKMQRADGPLYHKASCKNFCGFIMPDKELEPMVLSPVSVTATADFAAVCAMAIRFYKPYDEAYAQVLETASKKAYDAMKKMDLPGGFKNPPEITTGEYGDTCDMDERYYAAAELYKAFGDEIYRQDFEAIAKEKIYHGYGWGEMGSFGNIAYLTCGRPVDEAIAEKIKASMIKLADKRLEIISNDGYGTALKASEYVWGSNLSVCNYANQLYDAYKLTNDEKYLHGAMEQLHYLLGRNPMGQSYVSDCGTTTMRYPHHRPSGYLGKALPGMVSGGPCDWLADETAKSVLTKDTPPAKCFVDMTGSYSTNEVTIYWNSPFIQLMAAITK